MQEQQGQQLDKAVAGCPKASTKSYNNCNHNHRQLKKYNLKYQRHEGPHEDRDHIRNVLSHAPTRNPHLGCPPAQFPKSHQGSCIRQRDLGTNHPSRPAGDLWVQLLPAVGVKQREPHRDVKPQVPKPQDMQSPWEKHTGVTNFCRQQAGGS